MQSIIPVKTRTYCLINLQFQYKLLAELKCRHQKIDFLSFVLISTPPLSPDQ